MSCGVDSSAAACRAQAQSTLAARGEVAPEWAFMADDDSFAFDSQLLATLKRYGGIRTARRDTGV